MVRMMKKEKERPGKGLIPEKKDGILPEICVLLSAYNGEKYICQQLESILSQKDVRVTVFIRDDGSGDGTVPIIQAYADDGKQVLLFQGSNIGSVGSFCELAGIACAYEKRFDWYAFSDQDDLWLPDKLSAAVKLLKREEQAIPLLYCSNLQVTDESLNPRETMHPRDPAFTRTTALVHNLATGCTEVFNWKALELFCRGESRLMEFHDYWMYLVCMYSGKVIYDPDAYILYRQHSQNVVGARKKDIRSAVKNIKSDGGGRRQRTLTAFLERYPEYLSKKDKKRITRLLKVKYSLSARAAVLLHPAYRGNTAAVTVGFKIRALCGILY